VTRDQALPQEAPAEPTGERPLIALSRLNAFLTRAPYSVVVLITLVIAGLKTGLFFHSLVTPQELDRAGSFVYLNADVGPNLVVSMLRLVGIRTFTGYESATLLFSVVCLVAIAFILARTHLGPEPKRLVAVVLMGGPLAVVLFGHFGSNDPAFLVAAIAIAAFPRRWLLVVGSSVLMALSNPGQAVLVGLSLGAISLIPQYRRYVRAFITLTALSMLTFLLVVWRSRIVDGPSQATYFFSDLARALQQNSLVVPLLIYSGYGVLTFIFLWAVLDMRGWSRLLLIGVLFVLPIMMVVSWIDGTRYVVNLTALPATVLLIQYAPDICSRVRFRGRGLALGLAFITTLIFPLIHVFGGTVRQPYEYVLSRSEFYLNVLF